jgi:hypothetical protein
MREAPPTECRIHSMGVPGDPEFNRRYVAKLNRNSDLPFYLANASIKIVGPQEKITDADLIRDGIELLPG